MNWKYFIPHVWQEEETTWEDIYLRKVDRPEEKALFLSINSRLMWDDSSSDEEYEKRIKLIIEYLNTHDYMIDEPEMYISLDTFNREQFLDYTNIFLQSKGYKDNNLIEGTYEEFIEEMEQSYQDRMVD